MRQVRFRRHAGATLGALLAGFGVAPIATTLWYPFLVPVLLVPLAVALWAWRSGTDVSPAGVTVRALLGTRRLAWPEVDGFARSGRGLAVVTRAGRQVRLPALAAADLPRLLAVANQTGAPARAGTAAQPDRPVAPDGAPSTPTGASATPADGPGQ